MTALRADVFWQSEKKTEGDSQQSPIRARLLYV